MILKARILLPVTSPPILDGAVKISGNRITALGRSAELPVEPGEARKVLGNHILLPGLVNAHCHLDYTDMAGQIPAQKLFTDWIKLITTTKAGWSYSEFAASWVAGARMLLETGTTTVADVEASPELVPEVWSATPLRVHSFLELTGVKHRRDPRAILAEAVAWLDSLPAGRCRGGLSPHAPYSTVPELLRVVAQFARQRGCRITTHVAESALEFEMFNEARGEMHRWLARNERDMSDCGLGTPVQHLHQCGLLSDNLLAVHANCLGSGDVELLAVRRVSVAHCPRSHAYFSHPEFPFAALERAGVNTCLGTDSLATVTAKPREPVTLNLFEEMRAFKSRHPAASSETILRLCTLHGARALGLEGEIGEISKGALADLIAIPCPESLAADECHEAVLRHKGPVGASMIDGQWAIAPEIES